MLDGSVIACGDRLRKHPGEHDKRLRFHVRDLLANKALNFFAKYPTLNDALESGDQVTAVHGEQAWSSLQHGGRWQDGLYLECLRAEARALVGHIQALKEGVAELDRQLEKLATQPAVAVLLTLPGVGLRTALSIVGDTGQPNRFRNTHHYVAYRGLAPVTHQSGGGGPSPKSRERYNRHLKRAFLLLAFSQIRWNAQARSNYERKRASEEEPLGGRPLPGPTTLPHRLQHACPQSALLASEFNNEPIDIEDSKSPFSNHE